MAGFIGVGSGEQGAGNGPRPLGQAGVMETDNSRYLVNVSAGEKNALNGDHKSTIAGAVWAWHMAGRDQASR